MVMFNKPVPRMVFDRLPNTSVNISNKIKVISKLISKIFLKNYHMLKLYAKKC